MPTDKFAIDRRGQPPENNFAAVDAAVVEAAGAMLFLRRQDLAKFKSATGAYR